MAFLIRCTMVLTLMLSLGTTIADAHRAPEWSPDQSRVVAIEPHASGDPLDRVENGWVNRTSGAIALRIDVGAGPYGGTPETAARAYLADAAGEFGLSHAGRDLRFRSVKESPVGQHVRFDQAIGTVPIWKADLVVSLDRSGTHVRAVRSNYDPILAHETVITTPVIDQQDALEAVLEALGITEPPRWIADPSEELWILRQEDRVGSQATLAWRVSVPIEEPLGEWEVFISAIDGTVLRLTDRAVYTDGSGYVFDPDPLTTAEVSYGGNYADNSDSDTAELNAERFLRTLPDLSFSGGVYHLDGPYVELIDFESPSGAPVTNPDPNGFTYTRSQQGFEDVMCYYHIDANQRYMQSLGFNTIQNGPIGCDPHGLNGQDNSHYLPGSNRVAFGEGGVDDDEDADVIIHEYGHAIQHDIVPGWGGGHQGAMGEGFGDYWAGSHSAAISLFRWNWVFNWDGHNQFWSGRVLNTTKHYPENWVGQVHSDGEIWSAPWMQIYFECGRAVTDTDMLQHHFYQSSYETVITAATYAMLADLDLYGGLHSGSMDAYFTARGFFDDADFDVPELTHTPLGDQETGGPYPITVTIQSTSNIVAGSVKVRFGTGETFDSEATLSPTGELNEWGGEIPGQGGDVDIRYYIVAENTEGWTGAHPRGAEYQFHQFHVPPLQGIEDLGEVASLDLSHASPNPFYPTTTLHFALPQSGSVRLQILDLNGREVRRLVDGEIAAGRHAALWDGRDNDGHALPNGLYFVRLRSEQGERSRKVLLAK